MERGQQCRLGVIGLAGGWRDAQSEDKKPQPANDGGPQNEEGECGRHEQDEQLPRDGPVEAIARQRSHKVNLEADERDGVKERIDRPWHLNAVDA